MVFRVLVIAQDLIFADALATWLDTQDDMTVVAALHDRAPSPRVLEASLADVVLLDADLPGDAAFRVCEERSEAGGGPKVIMLSQSSEPERIVRALRAGVLGWVAKDESLDRLRQVIHAVARGETWLSPEQTGAVLRLLLRGADPEKDDDGNQLLAALTPREREVLKCLAEGNGRRDMAAHLQMSPNTVRTHLQNLMGKLGVHSTLEAVALTRPHVHDQFQVSHR